MSQIDQTDELGAMGLPRGTRHEFAIDNDQALAGLVNLIAVLTDNEYFCGLRISQWAPGGPSMEASVACAAIVQDKLGHCRALYPLLEELPWPNPPTPLQREHDRTRRYSVSYLDERLPSWAHVVAALALIGPALNTMYTALTHSAYETLARRAERILDEEQTTAWYTEGLVRDLADTPEGLASLQACVDVLLPEMLCWFGPRDEPGLAILKREGYIAQNDEELRQSYLDRVAPLLLEVGLRLPLRQSEADQRWEYDELPWNTWNQLQRRLGASPTSN